MQERFADTERKIKMFWILISSLIMCTGFGILYPAGAIVYYKIRYPEMTVTEILEVIGW